MQCPRCKLHFNDPLPLGACVTLLCPLMPKEKKMPDGEKSGFTIDQVQKIYLDTKDAVDALAKKHALEMDPMQKRMEVAKAWMLDYLNKQGLDNAKTAHGTVFKSNVMSATVDPEDGWNRLLRFVLEAGITRVLDALEQGASQEAGMDLFMQEPALALLNHSVNKTSVKEYLEQGTEVPGVKIAHVTQLNVRRS